MAVKSKANSTAKTCGSPPCSKVSSATPPTDIEKQHQDALTIVGNGIAYSESETDAGIPLTAKTRPVLPEDDDIPVWSSRGFADIKALQELVRSGYNQQYAIASNKTTKKIKSSKKHSLPTTTPKNFWSPDYAADQNVSISRPSHDAWGIPKIVLIFCDDFCQDVYEFPWWSTFAPSVLPILDVLSIPQDRVVRMLLASLPPGVTIPVHNDSGEWVKCTHRVHVPILVHDPTKVLFRCGRSTDFLEATIRCAEGHVFEINNQAQHTVSNCDSDYRVHLILDYVDPEFLEHNRKGRIQLQPGEKLLQTRRSIDRLSLKGIRPTPSFLILGAQKAGTTFLYELIIQHPLVVKPRRRETHCLDWRWRDDLESTEQRRQWCHQFYFEKELQLHPSCLTGDSTPSYLMDSVRVIPRLKQVFPWPIKFFVMLRDAVHRAESHYAMVTSPEGSPAQLKTRGSEWRSMSFDEVVWEDLNRMKACGLLPYWSLPESVDPSSENPWKSCLFDATVFREFSGSTKEENAWRLYLEQHVPLHTGSYGLLSRGLYELNLRPWLAEFRPENFLILRLETLSDNLDDSLSVIWNHLDIPHVGTLEDTLPKNTREYISSTKRATTEFLREFFQPHDKKLRLVLRQTRCELGL